MDVGEKYEQMEFRDGKLVRGDRESYPGEDSEVETGEEVTPNSESGFKLAIKTGALEVNQPLLKIQKEEGRVLDFGSRELAERYAAQLSVRGGDIRVQGAAPNDPDDVHGYLLAKHERSIKEPAEVDGRTWTFDVGANLYGALGEAVVKTGSKPPAIEYFVKRDIDRDDLEVGLQIRVTDGKPISFRQDDDKRIRWSPDCCIEARDGWDGELIGKYWCEVKSGDASFERRQVETMERLAAEARVLKIRVDIEELPDQYSVRIHEVEPRDE